tara:strand:+ start:5976 stop:6563 length:588 start_codon:yes stop_codon:yes gene_type:complete
VKTDLFSIPLFTFDVESQKKELHDLALKLEKENNGNNVSNQGGFQSQPFGKENEVYKKFIGDNIELIFKELSDTYDFRSNVIKPSRGWLNVNRKGAYNLVHSHCQHDFVGVYYIKVPEGNTGNLVVINPDRQNEFTSYENLEYNKYNQGRFSIKPKENLLLIFPGGLDHYVLENKTNDYRISMSFNMDVIDENDN